jgi:hypothetical protein
MNRIYALKTEGISRFIIFFTIKNFEFGLNLQKKSRIDACLMLNILCCCSVAYTIYCMREET